MGLFGRDERTDVNNPSPAENKPRQRSAQTGGSSVTLIAKTSQIDGEIKGAGEVRIEGSVKGKIDCSEVVIVDPGGKVDGELRAETIAISGKVVGNVFGEQKIELTPTADVEGDMTSPKIVIREGATFEGQVFMTGKKKSPAPEKPKKTEKDEKADEPAKNA